MSKKILICDDDPVVRFLMTECLRLQGFTVEAFGNGTEFMQYALANTPDILFLDVIMPDQSGFDLLKTIRSESSLAKLPVVMLSANAEDRRLQAAAGDLKPDRFLEKPWQMQQLIDTVEELTKGS